MMKSFNFEYADKSLLKKEIEFHPTAIVLSPKEAIFLRATRREKK